MALVREMRADGRRKSVGAAPSADPTTPPPPGAWPPERRVLPPAGVEVLRGPTKALDEVKAARPVCDTKVSSVLGTNGVRTPCWEYSIAQIADWGGVWGSFERLLPEAAYFNLSAADHVEGSSVLGDMAGGRTR